MKVITIELFFFSDAPEFHDKPHIVQRDGGNIIVIKVRAKSHLEMTAEWFKVLHLKPSSKNTAA